MASALRAAGFSLADIPIGVAVGLAESGGRTDAVHVNANRSVDRGVWQIDTANADIIRKDGNVFNLQDNARMAKDIHDRQGWQAWSTYTSGKYKLYNGQAGAVMAQQAGAVMAQQASWWNDPNSPFQLPGQQDPKIPVVPDPNSGLPFGLGTSLGGVTHTFAVLGNPDWWKRVGLGAAGVLIALLGIFTMIESNQTVQKVSAIAAV